MKRLENSSEATCSPLVLTLFMQRTPGSSSNRQYISPGATLTSPFYNKLVENQLEMSYNSESNAYLIGLKGRELGVAFTVFPVYVPTVIGLESVSNHLSIDLVCFLTKVLYAGILGILSVVG